MVVGVVASPRSRMAKTASAYARISGRASCVRAKRAFEAVYSWPNQTRVSSGQAASA